MQDDVITRYLEVRIAPPDEAALKAYIATMNQSPVNLLLGIFPKDNPDVHVGNIKLGPISAAHKVAAVGILIGSRDMWGRGFAREAISAIAEKAFSTLNLVRLEAGFYVGNEASIRAFKAAGFVEEGRRRSARVFEGGRVDEIIMGRLNGAPEQKKATS